MNLPSFPAGNVLKSKNYLADLSKKIAGQNKHPRHLGVKMQAHHVISAEAMKNSGLGEKIAKMGYNINHTKNLVFIPCTLQGACYLGIQPHRGNHTAVADPDAYDEDNEPDSYHRMVERKISALALPLSRECEGDDQVRHLKVLSQLNGLSNEIVEMIQETPTRAPLTSVARYFAPDSKIGCGGVDSVTSHPRTIHCAVERNHAGRQGPGQAKEEIKFVKEGRYKLGTGK